jgi:ABC-2 type transport system ATP-binding protein
VGGEILDIDLEDGDEARERAVEVAESSGLFEASATVEATADGITVTSRRARERGTDLLVALRDAGLEVVGFNVRAPTLDDVFLAITGEHLDGESEADEADETADEGAAAAPEVGR